MKRHSTFVSTLLLLAVYFQMAATVSFRSSRMDQCQLENYSFDPITGRERGTLLNKVCSTDDIKVCMPLPGTSDCRPEDGEDYVRIWSGSDIVLQLGKGARKYFKEDTLYEPIIVYRDINNQLKSVNPRYDLTDEPTMFHTSDFAKFDSPPPYFDDYGQPMMSNNPITSLVVNFAIPDNVGTWKIKGREHVWVGFRLVTGPKEPKGHTLLSSQRLSVKSKHTVNPFVRVPFAVVSGSLQLLKHHIIDRLIRFVGTGFKFIYKVLVGGVVKTVEITVDGAKLMYYGPKSLIKRSYHSSFDLWRRMQIFATDFYKRWVEGDGKVPEGYYNDKNFL